MLFTAFFSCKHTLFIPFGSQCGLDVYFCFLRSETVYGLLLGMELHHS